MPTKDIVLISECISAPFDEGFKNVIYNLVQSFIKSKSALVLTKANNNTDGLNVKKVKLNKLMLNKKLRSVLRENLPKIILYIPEASCTFNSFIRGKVIRLWSKQSKILILGAQHRKTSAIKTAIIANFLKPDLLLLLGSKDKDFYLKRGLKVKVLPPAVDCLRFSPATRREKQRILAGYNIPINKTVVLHVGHMRANRNVESLLEVQKIGNIQVVVVGSTSTEKERNIKNKLITAGIRVIDEFVPDISKIYKMSDIYVFPVQDSTAAIDMPLSVIEAMACNLPVITTRFGGLVDFFKEDSAFRYFNTTEELVELIKDMENVEIHNNKKVEPFTWDRFSGEIITACNDLI